ncbi:hypothetical protein A176_000166 [Myxococcus hansupus]|uniref:Uncharacterized protein n=1 Tax=Pseudomyxococcus hansupus TaxID=1297742 RepID=A0A0H4WKI8_9BACT|nr:hypothetical protein A176_000166 [Myxococcus hansupus]
MRADGHWGTVLHDRGLKPRTHILLTCLRERQLSLLLPIGWDFQTEELLLGAKPYFMTRVPSPEPQTA